MIKEKAIGQAEASVETPSTVMDVLRNRDFLKLWLAQMLSQTAQQIVNIALVVQVDQISSSSTAVSGIIIAFSVPAVLFAAIAGVFVERNSKKTMLVITNVARGVMVLAYLFADPSWAGVAVLPIFYIVTFLFATVSQLFNPAEASMIPLIVKRKELIAANALFNLTLTGTALLGFVLIGPVLIATIFHDNFNGLYLIISVLCMAAAALTYFLPQDKPAETAAERRKRGEKVGVGQVTTGATQIARSGVRTAWDELLEGWHFIRGDHVVSGAIIYWSVAIAVFMMIGTIGPGFMNRVLGLNQSQLIYILLPGGVGLVLGVLLVGRLSRPENRERMINVSLLAAAIALILFAATEPILRWAFSLMDSAPPITLMLVVMGFLTLLLGLFNSFISVPAQTALQERTPEKIRARVFSAFYTVANAAIVLPVLFAATSADKLLGYQGTIAFIGLVVLMIAAYGAYRNRKRQSDTRPLSMGGITPQETEAALTVASPAPRPIPADIQQEDVADNAFTRDGLNRTQE